MECHCQTSLAVWRWYTPDVPHHLLASVDSDRLTPYITRRNVDVMILIENLAVFLWQLHIICACFLLHEVLAVNRLTSKLVSVYFNACSITADRCTRFCDRRSKLIPIQVCRTPVLVDMHTCRTAEKATKCVSCWDGRSMPSWSSPLDDRSLQVKTTPSYGTIFITKLVPLASECTVSCRLLYVLLLCK